MDLIKKGAIKKCYFDENQFISDIFLVPKSNGKDRLVINLKSLNKFIKTEHFKLEDGRTVTKLLGKGDFMASLDLKDAYYLIPVHESCHKYLRFKFKNALFEFVCLPFGLNTAPYVFTKILKPVISHLRLSGFLSVIYLDDLLIIGNSFKKCRENLKKTRNLLTSLGFIINEQKSCLVPSQICCYLGFIYDSLNMSVDLTEEKKFKLLKYIRKIKVNQKLKIRDFAKLIGFLVSCCPAVNYGWLYTKECERLKFLALDSNKEDYDAYLLVSKESILELDWWKKRDRLFKNPIREMKFFLEIYSDASLSGWGIFCNKQRAYGHWNGKERQNSINFLEILAAFFGLKCFAADLRDCQILLHIDNTTAISYINRMGGIQFLNLNEVTRNLWQWCEERNIWVYATYISSSDNVEADFQSRRQKSTAEIEISDKAFVNIIKKFGKPKIDLFASRTNAKCKRYVSWQRDPNSFAIDAFTIRWDKYFFYAFPPFSMILKTLQKIRNEEAKGIVIIPDWPAQAWYPLFNEMLISTPYIIKAANNLIFPHRVPDQFWSKVTLVVGVLSGKPSN